LSLVEAGFEKSVRYTRRSVAEGLSNAAGLRRLVDCKRSEAIYLAKVAESRPRHKKKLLQICDLQ